VIGPFLLALALAAPAEPYVVLRADGSRILLMEPPRAKGRLLIGRLWPDGTLVSFPASEVAARGAPPPPAPPSATPTRSLLELLSRPPRPTPVPLGDKAKLNRPRAEAEHELKKASGTARKEEPEPGGTATPLPAPRVPDPVDVKGRGEEWWRARADGVHREIASAREGVAGAEAELDTWERNGVPPGGGDRSWWGYELQQRRDAVDRAKERLADAQRRQSELEDEARRAGAYPGWVR
jgi:hypothetical protein